MGPNTVASTRPWSFDMSMVYNHWGVSIVRDCVCWSPGQLTRVGQLSRTGSTIGNEKQPPVPRLSYHATVEPPPPTSQRLLIT